MYLQFFGLTQAPFSITPDPAFVFLSARHEDALAHLKYGITEGGGGGFVQLTGEVGTGKTTLSRCLLEDLPENISVALILNPRLPPLELLEAICEELKVSTRGARESQKKLVDRLNRYLLKAHGEGRNVVLIIDEAQNLSPEALEQVRLLTNLETATKKLLQIVLLGQPELRELLARADLRQLAQRITARYHLTALDRAETADYLGHRLRVAGALENLFTPAACRAVHRHTGGVPRLINVVAERALVATYAAGDRRVTPQLVNLAAHEVMPPTASQLTATGQRQTISQFRGVLVGLSLATAAAAGLWWWNQQTRNLDPPSGGATLSTLAPNPMIETREPSARDAATSAASTDKPSAQPTTPDWVQSWDQAYTALAANVSDAGLALPDRSSCPEGETLAIRCRKARASVTELAGLQRPVLLQLSQAQDHYAMVEFSDSAAQVFDEDRARWLDLRDVEQRWSGLYVDLFKVPGYVPDVLREGDRGPGVLWVKNAARQATPAYQADPNDPYFGPALRLWAESFQKTHQLPQDGLIGMATLQRLAGHQDMLP
ncbi:MAG: ExeA family protein [Lysobacterales bacterium]